jgi:hypothetical protein
VPTTQRDLARLRLRNEFLLGKRLVQPEDVVGWLGAVQAQDYGGAKWAVAQRTAACEDAAVEQAFAAGRILRLHVLRPTWHFVAPEDVRWLVQLTAPAVQRLNAYQYRRLELDPASLRRGSAAIARALALQRSLR